jgi:hypothetical protein
MVQVTFTDSNKIIYDDHAFYQYDFGQELVISGLTLPPTVQVHFARKNVPALINIGATVDGVMTVLVPADTLKYEGEFNVYIYVSNETSGKTYKTITFYTRAREMPGDYAVPDEPDVIQVLMNKLDQIIATGIADYQPHIDTVNGMIAEYVPVNLIVNNDAATVPGKALDAVRGKALRDSITAILNSIKNNLTTVTAGSILDASQGKILKDQIDAINNNLAYTNFAVTPIAGITITGTVSRSGKGDIRINLTITGAVLGAGLGANVVTVFPQEITGNPVTFVGVVLRGGAYRGLCTFNILGGSGFVTSAIDILSTDILVFRNSR